MGATLKQRNFFVTKIFEITGHSLKVGIKRPLSFIEDEFKFEELTNKLVRKQSFSLYALIPTLLFAFGTLITIYSHFFDRKDPSSADDILFYLIPSIIFAAIAILSRENAIKLILADRRAISFYAKSPDKDKVTAFLYLLLAEQKRYLLNRYAKADPYLSTEQLVNNLNWLRDRNTITDEELQELRLKILPRPSSGSSVGFKFNPSAN